MSHITIIEYWEDEEESKRLYKSIIESNDVRIVRSKGETDFYHIFRWDILS